MTKTIVLNLFNRDINFSSYHIEWLLDPIDVIYLSTYAAHDTDSDHYISKFITPLLYSFKSQYVRVIVLVHPTTRLNTGDISLTYLMYSIYSAINTQIRLVDHSYVDIFFVMNGKCPWNEMDHLNKLNHARSARNPAYNIPITWNQALRSCIEEMESKENNIESFIAKTGVIFIDTGIIYKETKFLSILQLISLLDQAHVNHLKGKVLSLLSKIDNNLDNSLLVNLSNFMDEKIEELESEEFTCRQYEMDSFQPVLNASPNDIYQILSKDTELSSLTVEGVSLMKMNILNQLIDTIAYVKKTQSYFLEKMNFSKVSSNSHHYSMENVKKAKQILKEHKEKIENTLNHLNTIKKDFSQIEGEYKEKSNKLLVELNNEVQKQPNKLFFRLLTGFSFLFFVLVSVTLLYNEVYREPFYMMMSIIFFSVIVYFYRYYIRLNYKKIAALEKKIKQHQNEMSVSLYEMLKTNFDISVEQFKLMIIGNNLEMLKEVKDKHAERMQALCGTKHILSLNIDKKTLAKSSSTEIIETRTGDLIKVNINARANVQVEIQGSTINIMAPLSNTYKSITLNEKTAWV